MHIRNIFVIRRRQSGFTLIELMIVVVVIAILASIALPAYKDYVTRARLVDAVNALTTLRAKMEQHYQDNRSYLTVGSYTTPCSVSSNLSAGSFTLACPANSLTDSGYTITATGSGQTAGFIYTLDQNGTQTTTGLPSGWGSTPQSGCWVQRKGQTC